MRNHLAIGAVVAAIISRTVADLCSEGSTEEAGNWYCQAVQKISYSGLGTAGQYQKVNNMYPSCQQSAFDYSGPLSPFDEEVSMHFRGPMVINQVAVYTPSGSSSKARRGVHERRHGHAGFHKRNKEIREIQERSNEEKRQVGAMVTATIDGKVVSWTNEYAGPGSSPATPAPEPVVSAAGFIGNQAAPPAPAAAKPFTPGPPAAAGDWVRSAYYDQGSQTAEGLVFLNNMGGGPSGVFDDQYGNSLSYASSDGTAAAAGPEVSNGTLASNQEFIIFSDKQCEGDSCGYFRDGSVAYHGFDGAEKAFFFEFSMPDDGTTGFNANMPSGWLLNAQIARTAQYSSCSCWGSGCGEFDWCEVLNSGNSKCKSTWHGNTPGGSSDYFDRPTGGPIKMAVVMANSQINVQVLDSSTAFGTSMAQSTINSICSSSTPNILTSLFSLGS